MNDVVIVAALRTAVGFSGHTMVLWSGGRWQILAAPCHGSARLSKPIRKSLSTMGRTPLGQHLCRWC